MSLELVKTFLMFLAGGFLVFLAITITRDNFTSRLNRVAGAMLFFAGLGPIFMGLASIMSSTTTTRLEESPLYNVHVLWEFFFPSLLLFSWIFPIDRLRNFKYPRLQYLIFLPTILHFIVSYFFDDVANVLASLSVPGTDRGFLNLLLEPFAKVASWLLLLVGLISNYQDKIFTIINLTLVAGAAYFLESGRRYITNPRLMPQSDLVVWATRIGLGLFVVVQILSFWPDTLPAGMSSFLLVAGILVATGLLTYATIRYQFLDVRLIFRQSFVYTISSGLIVGVYIFIVLESQEVLQPIVGDQARVLAYVLIIFLLLVFQPINNWIDNIIRSMFIRTRTDHRNVIERFSRQVISLFDPVQLRLIIEETLKTALLVERVYFVLYDDKIGEYVLIASDDFPRRTILQRDDLMLRGINLLDTPSFMHSLSDYGKDSKLADHLKQRGVRLVLPMKDAKHLLGFLALTSKAAGYRYSSEDLNLLGVLSNTMVSALTNARLYVESLERVRLQEEVSMARQIQLDLLPSSPPKVEGVAISVHATPSRTVGGDFYDFVKIDDKHLGVVIADASGKGMPAALMIAQIQAIVHSEVNNGNEISRMIANMNRIMYTALSSEKYVTLFYGVFNFEEKTFDYVNAGHNYPLLVHSDGDCEELKIGGPIIGALPGMVYQSARVDLNHDDLIFLFTDGLSEAMDSAEREYGEERVKEFVCTHREHEPSSLVELILKDVRAHDPSDPPADDTTIIAIKLSLAAGNGDQAHDIRREEAVRPEG